MNWTGREPCRKDHADLWFGGTSERRPNMSAVEKAKMLCRNECPLTSFHQCAQQALHDRPTTAQGVEGVWGGVYLPSPTNGRRRPERDDAIKELKRMVAQLNSRKAS